MRLCIREGGTGFPDGRVGMAEPRDARLGEDMRLDEVPTVRLTLVPLVYRLAVGTGRNVGVVGLEMGVGMELIVLDVAFVLTLLRPSDVRDCGRRIPVGIWLCDIALGERLSDGEMGDAMVEDNGRNADGAMGPDLRRCILSLSLSGEGLSSMIRTHPEVLPAGVLTFSALRSRLCDFCLDATDFSGDDDRRDDFELDVEGDRTEEGPALGVLWDAAVLTPVRLVTLPMRIRGTRVWIFCPSTSTRARISDSI